MNQNTFQQYKPAKNILEQLQYLNEKKRVQFNEMNKEMAENKLLQYNYINVITPFKHKFAKKPEVIDGNMKALKNTLEKVNKIQ